MDDSGTRHPDHKQGKRPAHGYDWFGLGGVLIKQGDDEENFRSAHKAFIDSWGITAPLHSSEIRAMSGAFAFVGILPEDEQKRFYEELYQLMATAPAIGIACVIDRPGYNDRYNEKYMDGRKWLLCKSAFSIVVERAAKYAVQKGLKLRVWVEKSDKKVDRTIKDYYDGINQNGMPFASETSGKYAPMDQEALADILYEFRTKSKSSPLLQLADLYLWPMCIGGYDENNRPYKRLREDEKLIDCHLSEAEIEMGGIKYFCFDFKKSA